MINPADLIVQFQPFWCWPKNFTDIPTWFVIRCIQLYQLVKGYDNWRAYHVKVVVQFTDEYIPESKYVPDVICFEFAPPKAKYSTVTWDSLGYSVALDWWRVYRWNMPLERCDIPPDWKLADICDKYFNTRYDILELTSFILFRWLQFSKKWFVCSTGAIRILEEWSHRWVFGQKSHACPAAIADSDQFEEITSV